MVDFVMSGRLKVLVRQGLLPTDIGYFCDIELLADWLIIIVMAKAR
jgi:hypothetical protein